MDREWRRSGQVWLHGEFRRRSQHEADLRQIRLCCGTPATQSWKEVIWLRGNLVIALRSGDCHPPQGLRCCTDVIGPGPPFTLGKANDRFKPKAGSCRANSQLSVFILVPFQYVATCSPSL